MATRTRHHNLQAVSADGLRTDGVIVCWADPLRGLNMRTAEP